MTRVRGKRGRLVHVMTYGVRQDLAPEDVPAVLCGVRITAPIIEPDEPVTCERCHEISTTN